MNTHTRSRSPGLDLGGSSVKAGLIDATGAILAESTVMLPDVSRDTIIGVLVIPHDTTHSLGLLRSVCPPLVPLQRCIALSFAVFILLARGL